MVKSGMAENPIALQLYTLRSQTAGDFPGALRLVAGLGYRAVEFAGYGGLSSAEIAKLLEETGLRTAATHVRYAALEERLDEEIEYCRAIGCSYLVLPALDPEYRGDPPAMAARLERIAHRCGEHDISFAYHNHAWELRSDGSPGFLDRLLDASDPELVALELDVYWAAHAGVDPVSILERRAGRVPLIHLKDMAADGSMAEMGEGTLDLPGICAAARAAGAQWYIVENDRPRLPAYESARRALDYLRGLPV